MAVPAQVNVPFTNANNKTSSTTVAGTTASPATVAGNVLVVGIVFDNAATASKPTVTGLSVAAGETASWVFLGAARSTSTSAGAVSSGELWCIKTTISWPVGTVITATLDTAVTQKAMACVEYSGVLTTQRCTGGTAYASTATNASASTSGTTPLVNDLVVGFIFQSNATFSNVPNDTNGGTWVFSPAGSSGGSGATNNGGDVMHKILTSGVHQTATAGGATQTAGNGVIVAILQAAPDPSITQASYRFYADASESGSTALAAQDTAAPLDVSSGPAVTNLRFRLQLTANVGFATDDYQLQYEKNASGTWINTGDASIANTSAVLGEGQPTTNRLGAGTGTFVAGETSSDGTVNDLAWSAGNYTEVVYGISLNPANFVNGDTLRFRVLRNGATTGLTYTQVPTANVVKVSLAVTQAAYQFFDDAGTESGAASLAALNTALTANLSNGDGYGVVRTRLQLTTAVATAATDDWQLQYEKNGDGSWLNVAPAGSTVCDSYIDTGNYDAGLLLGYTGGPIRRAQSFTGDGRRLVSASFFLYKKGTAAGPLTVRLYQHSGTFGTSSVGTGTPIASSTNSLDASALLTTVGWFDFTFDGTYILESGAPYVLAVEASGLGADTNNCLGMGLDNSSPTHPGNASSYTSSWVATSTQDFIFRVYTTAPAEVVAASYAPTATGAVSNVPLTAAPGTNGVAQSFLGNGMKLTRVSFDLRKTGTPPGNATCTLYAHTGTFGAGGQPTGAALATSSTVLPISSSLDANNIRWIDFVFDGTFTLTNGTPYFVALAIDTPGDGSNSMNVFYTSASGLPGQSCFLVSGAWVPQSGDLLIQVFTGALAVVGYDNPNLTDGAATTNRLGAGTGTFVAGEISETGLVTDLGWSASNYTELVYSVKLVAVGFAIGDVVRFRVLRNGATTAMTYTQTPTINVTSVAVTQASYRLYADGTETGSTALAAQDTAYTANMDPGDLNMGVRARLQSTTTMAPGSTDDWLLQYELNGSGTWVGVGPAAEALSATYPLANADSSVNLGVTGFASREAQSFIGDGRRLTKVGFNWFKNGTLSGTVSCTLYAHSGTYGVDGVPTGSPLATATTTFDAATMGTGQQWYYFVFDGSFTLVAGTPYFAVLNAGSLGADGSNCLHVSSDFSSPTWEGTSCWFDQGSWTLHTNYEMAFEVYTSPPAGLAVVAYLSPNLTDAAATTNRLGAGTGTFVAGKVAEDGKVDDLTWTANNYTEVLYSLTLVKAALNNGTTVRFRIVRNYLTSVMTYTQTPTINATKTVTVTQIAGASGGVATSGGTTLVKTVPFVGASGGVGVVQGVAPVRTLLGMYESPGGPFGTGVYTTASMTPPSAGTVCVVVAYETNNTNTVPLVNLTDSATHAWTKQVEQLGNIAATPWGQSVSIYTAPHTSGSFTLSVQAAVTTSMYSWKVCAFFYTGLDPSNLKGITGAFTGWAPSGVYNLALSNPSQPPSEVIGALVADEDTSNTNVTPGAGWTQVAESGVSPVLSVQSLQGSMVSQIPWVKANQSGAVISAVGLEVYSSPSLLKTVGLATVSGGVATAGGSTLVRSVGLVTTSGGVATAGGTALVKAIPLAVVVTGTATVTGDLTVTSAGGFGPQERMLDNTAPQTSMTGDYTIGARFTPTAAGRITHVRYWNASVGISHNVFVWTTSDGIVRASAVDPPAGAVGFSEAVLSPPLAVSAGVSYTAGYSTGGQGYSYSTPVPASLAPHLTGPAGYYASGQDQFPTTAADPYHYLVDVVYQAGVAGGAAVALAGSSGGLATVTSALAETITLGSTVSGTATVGGSTLVRAVGFVGASVGGTATVTSNVVVARALASSVAGVATVTSALTVTSGAVQLVAYVTGFPNAFPGTRNDYEKPVGLRFTLGADSIVVTHLARWFVGGTSVDPHTVKLVTATGGGNGADIAGGSVTFPVGTTVASGQYVYLPLAAPITLPAATTIYLVGDNVINGDLWEDSSTITHTAIATDGWSVYFNGSIYIDGYPEQCYGPVDFKYQVAVAGAVALAGSAGGSSTATSALAETLTLASTVNSAATVTATTLVRAVALAGSSAGVATDNAALIESVALASTINGAATAGATTLVRAVSLAGSADGVSTAGGTTVARAVPLASLSAGVATVAATSVLTNPGFSAVSAGVATTTSVVAVNRSFSSTVNDTSTVTGALVGAVSLAASPAGLATVTSAVAVNRGLVAASAGVATAGGTTVFFSTLALNGSAAGVATASATTMLSPGQISAGADGSSTVTGSLGVARTLAGQSNGVAPLVASMLGVSRPLVGASAGVATDVAQLNSNTTLASQSAGVATDTATLSRAVSFSGQSSGLSTVGATTLLAGALIASSNGLSTVVGSMLIARGLAATSAGALSPSGTLALARPLVGASGGSSADSGALRAAVALVGVSAGNSTVVGAAGSARVLVGASVGSSSARATGVVASRVKLWNGSQWVSQVPGMAPIQVWNGTTWVADGAVWDGARWQPLNPT